MYKLATIILLGACGKSSDPQPIDTAETDTDTDTDTPLTDTDTEPVDTDTEKLPGNVHWTSDGVRYSGTTNGFPEAYVINNGNQTELALNTPATTGDFMHLIVRTYGVGIVPAGDYPCEADAIPNLLVSVAFSFATASDGGSCMITLTSDAVDGGIVTGTFEGDVVSGGVHQIITDGSFTFQDEP